MMRDIDYAAIAVEKAIVEKFSHKSDLQNVAVTANERTISVRDSTRTAEGTRDNLLAAVRAAESYPKLWEMLLAPAEACASSKSREAQLP